MEQNDKSRDPNPPKNDGTQRLDPGRYESVVHGPSDPTHEVQRKTDVHPTLGGKGFADMEANEAQERSRDPA